MKQQFNIFGNIDKTTLFLYLAIVAIGWVNIFAVEYAETQKHVFDFSTSYGKQLIFIVTSLLLAAIVLMMDVRFFTGFAWVIYGSLILLLIAVLVFGVEINATRAWFRIGGLGFQPSEIAKYATALALASMASNIKSRKPGTSRRIKAFLVILVPAALVLLQKDVGTTLVFFAFFLVMYREGWINGLALFFAGLAILLFILTLIVSEFIIIGAIVLIAVALGMAAKKKPGFIVQLIGLSMLLVVYVYSVDFLYENVLQSHHKARIEVLVYGGGDLQGTGYNLHQSKIAIGSGGLWGKGFLQGTQTQFNFVPEQSTDFIFCTVGEEWGFAGSLIIIGLFLTLLLRLIFLSERQKSTFSRVFGYSAVSIIFIHFAINIGMTIGLVPIIGIPLPLISYGGSSLWAVTLFIFTFLKFDVRRMEML